MLLSRLNRNNSSFQFGTFVSLSPKLLSGSVRRAQTSHRSKNGQKCGDREDRYAALKIIDNESPDAMKPDHSNTVPYYAEPSNKLNPVSSEKPRYHDCPNLTVTQRNC